MEYISSDTNVWIDFKTIAKTELPFLLPYTYIMNEDAIQDEVLSPPGFGAQLVQLGLRPVELTEAEFFMAAGFASKYIRLSRYDRIALAIAKCRNITLLTGDKALRRAAGRENVNVLGTLGILDQLFDNRHISLMEYLDCLKLLERYNGGTIRLPKAEITLRLQRYPM